MIRILNDEELSVVLKQWHTDHEGLVLVATAQHQADLRAFIELLESHKFHDDYGGESAMIYRDSLVKTLKGIE